MESDCGGGDTAGAGLGDFSRVLFSAGCGWTRVNEEQRLPLASQEELECPNLQYDANPAARLESGRGNNHFKMNPSNSWMG